MVEEAEGLPIQRVVVPGYGHHSLSYHVVCTYRFCALAEEDESYGDPNTVRAITWHILYIPTSYTPELASLKGWLQAKEGEYGPVESSVYELLSILRDPFFGLSRVWVGAEERHDPGWSRDILSAEYSYSSPLTHTSARFDRIVDRILLGGPDA